MRTHGRLAVIGVVVVGTWLAISGQPSWPQVAAAVVAAVVVTSLVAFDERASGVRLNMPDGWPRAFTGLARDVVNDVSIVGREIIRRTRGHPASGAFVRVPVRGRDRREVMLAIMGAGLTPNTVVVGYDEDDAAIVIHQLDLQEDPASDIDARLP